MTGRNDVSPIPSVKAGNIYKNMQNLQLQEERPDLSKQAKRFPHAGGKSTKPTMEIYRPPKLGQKNGKVHFQMGLIRNKESPPPSTTNTVPTELKSALKRSKSFTSTENSQISSLGFEKDVFPIEYQALIHAAIKDPNSLSWEKLMELVRLICSKAVEKTHYSAPAADLCFAIIEKEHEHTFLESLQNCCHEWYNERDKLLRSPFSTSGTTFPGLRRWTAYIAFLMELYLRVKNQVAQAQMKNSTNLIGPHPNSPMAHFAMTLITLLYECLYIILKPPSLNNVGEIECFRTTLMTIGKQLESDSPQRMQHLVVLMRDAFINPSISAQVRKTLLEVVELHASSWQLDLSQMSYYFPYTTFDRN